MAFCGKMRSDSGEEMQIEVMTENEVVLQKFILLAESILKWKNTILSLNMRERKTV